ncbi:MAG TPA: hypothetical protein P5307_13205, partial [Pirellulaceae bacterium]|nr:hypothetical protein [Pirellulaceae bacterium]
ITGATRNASAPDIGAYESSEVFIQRFNYDSPNLNQFGTGEALIVGEGFSDGNNSRVREQPGFLGLEFDPDSFIVGPGVGEVLGAKVGGEAKVDLDGRVGFEYGYYVNSGSVSTNYDGLFSYTTETDAQNSDKFIIKTGLTLQDGSLFTVSPRVGAFLDMVFEFNAEITGEACLGGCANGTFNINIDESTPIFSINRQEVLLDDNDEPILDAQGNPQFLYLNSSGAETTTKAGNVPKLDGNVFIGESSIGDLADSVLDSAEQQVLDQAIEASGGYLAYLNLQRDTQRNARIDLATKTAEDFLDEVDAEDAVDALEQAKELYDGFVDLKEKLLQDAIEEEKKLTTKGDQPKKGVGTYITVSAGQAEGDLLGLEFELSLGARKGEFAVEKPLGKLAVTVPEIELEDREFDNNQGRLSASTSAFANGSEQDARRQLAALSIDVGAIGPLGTYRTNLGPLDIEATTVSYNVTPRIKLSQDVVVEPFFDADHAAIFELTFLDCPGVCTATVSGDVLHGAGTISSNASAEDRRIKFVPGSKIEIDTNGHEIEVAPYLNIGQRFTNDLGIDFDVVGLLEVLALKLSAFGKDILDVGPLIEEAHTLLDDIDLGSIFNATFDLDTTDQALKHFTLDSTPNQADNDGLTPGDAFVLPSVDPNSSALSIEDHQPGQFASGQTITPTQYFSVSLLDPHGIPQRDVRFETSGNQSQFIRPPYAGLQLEILDGDLVTSRFDLPIQGFTFPAGQAPKAFKLIGFENLLGSRAIFGLGFNTESSFDITASAQGGSGLTAVGENTSALNTVEMQDAGLLTLIENDFAFDIDGDGTISATTDGELVIRYMEGKTGNALIQGALRQNAAAQGATRADSVSILNYLRDLETTGRLDVDQNALVEKEFDGVLILRHLSGIGSSIESLPALTDTPGDGAL